MEKTKRVTPNFSLSARCQSCNRFMLGLAWHLEIIEQELKGIISIPKACPICEAQLIKKEEGDECR